jgi:hypothetical protein
MGRPNWLTAHQSESAVSLGFWQSGVPAVCKILEKQPRRSELIPWVGGSFLCGRDRPGGSSSLSSAPPVMPGISLLSINNGLTILDNSDVPNH